MSDHFAITGVSSGIGAELAKCLRASGHRITGFDLREPQMELDGFIRVDLSDPAAIASAIDAVHGPFNGLCNIAGLPPREGLEANILQVNFIGLRHFTYGLLPKLASGSAIVNMASRAGHGWRENIDQIKRLAALRGGVDVEDFVAAEQINHIRAYNLSKEALILWTYAEAEPMLARDIRINSISPGAVATGILDDFASAFGERMAKNVARAGRVGTPEEVARVAAFALLPESYWMKGIDIPLDGGMGAFAISDELGLDVLRQS